MKTTFSRQFALIAALLLVCMIFTGVSFRFLMLGYLKNDKKETLSADAAAVASLAEAYDSTGELEENWDFRLSLSLFSDVGEAEALVCDENGFVVLCSCDEFNCEHIGQQVDANLITEIDASGETFRVGSGYETAHAAFAPSSVAFASSPSVLPLASSRSFWLNGSPRNSSSTAATPASMRKMSATLPMDHP